MLVSNFKVKFYGGSILEDKDKNDKPLGTFKSYLSFVQINKEKNKMEQVHTTFDGDISERGLCDKTPAGAGLIAGDEYLLTLDLNLSNEKDKDGKAKATRHVLIDFAPVPVKPDKKTE